VSGTAAQSQEVFDKIAAVGVDLTDVFLVLENEGVDKFEVSWNELLEATAEQLRTAGQKS
jgi:transaldolase